MATAGTTHHVVLDDGTTQIGLIASDGRGNPTFSGWHREPLARNSFRTATGEQKYSDLEPPYFTIAQDDFKGGRGQEKFDDKTKFYDSKNLWTHTKNQCILGPRQAIALAGAPAADITNTPGGSENIGSYSLLMGDSSPGTPGGSYYEDRVAQKLTVGASSVVVVTVEVMLKKSVTFSGTPEVYVELYADDGGSPSLPTGSALKSAQLSGAEIDTTHTWHSVAFAHTLSAATSYWLCVYVANLDDNQTGLLGVAYGDDDSTPNLANKRTDDATDTGDASRDWTASTIDGDMFYKLLVASSQTIKKFAQHWNGGPMYAITNPAVGAVGKLYVNGDRGACDANTGALTTLIDGTKSWTTDEWAGCVVRIFEGAGEGEWRTISSNTATVLTVSEVFDTVHSATTSSYAILGSNKWTEITPTGTALTDTCTDIAVVGMAGDETYYIAQGMKADILKVKDRNNAGTWETVGAAVSTFKADLLAIHRTGTAKRLYRSYTEAAGDEMVSWTTNLSTPSFNTGVYTHHRITGMCVYNNTLYVFCNDMLMAIIEDKVETIDIDFTSMMDSRNGVNPTVYNMFLMFPLGYGLERLAGSTVDDIGPNRDAGLPDGRQGNISCMAAVVDALYAGIDAGIVDTSSVLAYNNFGWHELCRCATGGNRAGALYYQVIPGGPNRLWIGIGDAIEYVSMPCKTSNPYLADGMNYALTGELITSWVDIGMVNANKFWHELTVNAENLDADTYITCYYQTDTDTDASSWTLITDIESVADAGDGKITSSGASTGSITTDDSLAGKRIRFKFVLASNIATATPRLVAWSLEAVARMQSKFSYALPVKIFDEQLLLDRTKESNTAVTIMAKLNEWADGLEEKGRVPLTMTTMDPCATNKKVFVEAMEYRLSQLVTDAHGTVQVYGGTFRAIEA